MNHACTRRLEFDAAHRVERHGGKCRSLHGHRYTVEVTCAGLLDEVGVVVDFGAVKEVVGGFIDEHLDHTTVYDASDKVMSGLAILAAAEGMRPWYALQGPPTAEGLAEHLFGVAASLLAPRGVRVTHVRVYETPNCWADWSAS